MIGQINIKNNPYNDARTPPSMRTRKRKFQTAEICTCFAHIHPKQECMSEDHRSQGTYSLTASKNLFMYNRYQENEENQ